MAVAIAGIVVDVVVVVVGECLLWPGFACGSRVAANPSSGVIS